LALNPVPMSLFVRFLFAFTIGSHILLVSTSIALIVLISAAEFLAIRKNDGVYETLARRLSKMFVVSFGIGTASGIVMAVELVTLFPGFMTLVAQTGVIVLFYTEVFAFFLEVLALILYVYYWNSFGSRYAHWGVSLVVAAGTMLSAVFITMVNAWMNTPNGFDVAAFKSSGLKTVSQVQPWTAFLTTSTASEVAHVVFTTLFAGSMVIGCYFAYWLVRSSDSGEKEMLSRGMRIIGAIAVAMIVLSGLTGSNEMATLLTGQPLKYAALDANINPGTNLPDRFFGTVVNHRYVGGFEVPGLQSLLSQLETGVSSLPGLTQFNESTWPPLLVHTTFNVMAVGGMVLGVSFLAYFVALLLKKRPFESKMFLYLWVPLAVLSVVVYQLGWATDEIGRQPWIVYNVMTVDQAANLSSSLFIPGILVVLLYLLIVPATFYIYARVFKGGATAQERAVSG
jgi:cytochrome d ubiquinol oxidase subunit I